MVRAGAGRRGDRLPHCREEEGCREGWNLYSYEAVAALGWKAIRGAVNPFREGTLDLPPLGDQEALVAAASVAHCHLWPRCLLVTVPSKTQEASGRRISDDSRSQLQPFELTPAALTWQNGTTPTIKKYKIVW